MTEKDLLNIAGRWREKASKEIATGEFAPTILVDCDCLIRACDMLAQKTQQVKELQALVRKVEKLTEDAGENFADYEKKYPGTLEPHEKNLVKVWQLAKKNG